ncbi:MAG TPA: hypothetical protein ENI76_10420 [Ignavibacteria bacterium]|nr:hypothetical protein [Ignavibacteria bacterium]
MNNKIDNAKLLVSRNKRKANISKAFRMADIALRIASIDDESDPSGSEQTSAEMHIGYIQHKGDKWCVKSHNNKDWSGGCYDTKHEAEKRLKQVEMFKHMKS